MHSWLRPIDRGQFRFSNLGSHFIFVQIFQIDCSTFIRIQIFQIHFEGMKWTFVDFYDAMETFVKQLRKEKDTSWTLLSDNNIWLFTDICQTIFLILEVQFHHEGGLSMVYIFTMPKINLHWDPLQPFLNIDHHFFCTFQNPLSNCIMKHFW